MLILYKNDGRIFKGKEVVTKGDDIYLDGEYEIDLEGGDKVALVKDKGEDKKEGED